MKSGMLAAEAAFEAICALPEAEEAEEVEEDEMPPAFTGPVADLTSYQVIVGLTPNPNPSPNSNPTPQP